MLRHWTYRVCVTVAEPLGKIIAYRVASLKKYYTAESSIHDESVTRTESINQRRKGDTFIDSSHTPLDPSSLWVALICPVSNLYTSVWQKQHSLGSKRSERNREGYFKGADSRPLKLEISQSSIAPRVDTLQNDSKGLVTYFSNLEV